MTPFGTFTTSRLVADTQLAALERAVALGNAVAEKVQAQVESQVHVRVFRQIKPRVAVLIYEELSLSPALPGGIETV